MAVLLKEGKQADMFTLSGYWTAPRTVRKLSSGKTALLNITFRVPDTDITFENFLVGLLVFRYLLINSKERSENNRDKSIEQIAQPCNWMEQEPYSATTAALLNTARAKFNRTSEKGSTAPVLVRRIHFQTQIFWIRSTRNSAVR